MDNCIPKHTNTQAQAHAQRNETQTKKHAYKTYGKTIVISVRQTQ